MAPLPPLPPKSRDEVVREKINRWVKTSKTTQAHIAKLIGRDQVWMSRYLGGKVGADFETVERIAQAFGHPITALFDTPGDPAEARLIELFRSFGPDERAKLLALLTSLLRRRDDPPPLRRKS